MWNAVSTLLLSSQYISSQYIPHGHCYLWQTPLVALHVVSNVVIGIAYFSIPALLVYFVKKRQDVPFSGIFMLFGAFIILCGTGHFLDVWTLWHPDYWLSGLEHAATALVSSIAAVQMVTLLPQFLALKTPEQLEALNRELQQEILERQRIEAERNRAYEEMEFRVQERTADLEHANAALRESEARFQRLAANVPGMLYQYRQGSDGSSSLLYVSEACRKIYELEPEVMGAGYFEAIHPDDRQQRQDFLKQSAADLQSFEHEWRIIVPSGTVKWIQTISKPRQEPDGATIWDGIQMDVSDRKQAEAERQQAEANLQKERECLKAILDNLTDGIVACDENGQLMLFNHATCEFHGLPEAALPPEQWATHFDLYLGDGITPMSTPDIPLFRAFQGEIVHEAEMVIAPKQGKTRTLVASGRAFFDVDGNKAGAVVAMHDISDWKQAAAQREQLFQREQAAREEAERTNRIKDEFLAVLSHELRSPLNPILGWSRLLLGGKLNAEKQVIALATIERNAKLQAELIEDLLDVSRILQGKLCLTVQQVDLAAIIRAAIETVGLAAEAKSIGIKASLDSNAIFVLGDATRLQQMMWNLLSNAVKFTPAGGEVDVELVQVNDQAMITVHDNGTGIPPEVLPYIFDYFRQADSATTRKFGGLGLGLAIVRHLVELHGGRVKADSSGKGLGASFTVELPLMQVQPLLSQETPSSEIPPTLKGVQVLVVDDDTDTRELMVFLLEQAEAKVTSATSVSEALAVLTEFKPDILLSDIGMPDMDGYMFIGHIRALSPEQGGQIPAIALTAYAGDFNRKQALAAGFQCHLAKPIEPNELIKAIVMLLGK